MTLAARRAVGLKQKLVMRFGCVLVSLAVLASLVLEPPRAKAFAVTSAAVTALAGGFLNACGLAPVVSGMSSSGEVNESMARLIQDYLTAKRPGADMFHWLGDVKLQLTAGNKLLIPALVVGELTMFAKWVAEKYGTKPGENVVFSDQSITFSDGSTYRLASYTYESVGEYGYIVRSFVPGTPISIGTFDNPFVIQATNDFAFSFYINSSGFCVAEGAKRMSFAFKNGNYEGTLFLAVSHFDGSLLAVAPLSSDYLSTHPDSSVLEFNTSAFLLSASDLESFCATFSVDVSDTMQEVLDRLTALEEGQSVALDVGATSSMEIQDILQGILDAILAGDLAASAEIVDTAEVPVDPPPEEETPDIEGLGLPALGAALITRFPFSIPWDIYKGVSLLAAPPKAPYFEVDFLEPIAYRVGGWRGSTAIVLDFSEYEIIGQVCRWTSTVGFCLFLASGTKRLIWTA